MQTIFSFYKKKLLNLLNFTLPTPKKKQLLSTSLPLEDRKLVNMLTARYCESNLYKKLSRCVPSCFSGIVTVVTDCSVLETLTNSTVSEMLKSYCSPYTSHLIWFGLSALL